MAPSVGDYRLCCYTRPKQHPCCKGSVLKRYQCNTSCLEPRFRVCLLRLRWVFARELMQTHHKGKYNVRKPCKLWCSMSLRSFKEKLRNIKMKHMDGSIGLDLSMALTLKMIDQIKNLVQLSAADNINNIVSELPVKWGL